MKYFSCEISVVFCYYLFVFFILFFFFFVFFCMCLCYKFVILFWCYLIKNEINITKKRTNQHRKKFHFHGSFECRISNYNFLIQVTRRTYVFKYYILRNVNLRLNVPRAILNINFAVRSDKFWRRLKFSKAYFFWLKSSLLPRSITTCKYVVL